MSENAENREIMLSVDSVVKTDGEYIILDDVSFSVAKKGIHGILAPRGAGKTTLLDVISGSVPYDSGTVAVGSKHIYGGSSTSAADLKRLKKKMSYVRGSAEIYPKMTVMEFMTLVGEVKGVPGAKLYRQIKEALELTGLDDVQNRLIKNLTAQEHKFLGYAAALLGNPDVILIDEPKSAGVSFDRYTEQLYELIRMLGKHKTVVLATENFKIAKELCEDVIILSDGQVLAEGSFAELEAKLRQANSDSLEVLYNSLARASKDNRRTSLFAGDEDSDNTQGRRTK